MKLRIGMAAVLAALVGTAVGTNIAAAGDAPRSSAKVVVDEKGFTPSSVTVAKGQPATIEFTRTSDATCARTVVFPELKITKDLPLRTPVAVTVPAGDAKTYTFQCGMGMMKGSVVVQ